MSDIAIDTDTISVDWASSLDPPDLNRWIADLHALREIKKALSMWEGELTDLIAGTLGRNPIDVEGVGHVEVKHGANRKEWDRRALVRAVLDSRRAPDPATGEMVGSDSGLAVIDGEQISCSQDLARVLDVCWQRAGHRGVITCSIPG